MRLMISWIFRECDPELDLERELWTDEGRAIVTDSRDPLSVSDHVLADAALVLSSSEVISEIVFSVK
jgi:hypothetical protein